MKIFFYVSVFFLMTAVQGFFLQTFAAATADTRMTSDKCLSLFNKLDQSLDVPGDILKLINPATDGVCIWALKDQGKEGELLIRSYDVSADDSEIQRSILYFARAFGINDDPVGYLSDALPVWVQSNPSILVDVVTELGEIDARKIEPILLDCMQMVLEDRPEFETVLRASKHPYMTELLSKLGDVFADQSENFHDSEPEGSLSGHAKTLVTSPKPYHPFKDGVLVMEMDAAKFSMRGLLHEYWNPDAPLRENLSKLSSAVYCLPHYHLDADEVYLFFKRLGEISDQLQASDDLVMKSYVNEICFRLLDEGSVDVLAVKKLSKKTKKFVNKAVGLDLVRGSALIQHGAVVTNPVIRAFLDEITFVPLHRSHSIRHFETPVRAQ